MNRIYLLSTLIVGFTIPLITFPSVDMDRHEQTAGDVMNTGILPRGILNLNAEEFQPGSILDSGDTVVIIYWIGVFFFVIRLLYGIGGVIRIKKERVSISDGFRIFFADVQQPFCFFYWIFVPRDGVSSDILAHEKAHVQKLHGLDLMVMEICCSLLWFNPVMILFRRALRLQHEYDADAWALGHGASLEQYLNSLLTHLRVSVAPNTLSHFFSSHIKNRILMMTSEKTSLKQSLRYALVLPLTCILLFAFASPATTPTFPSDSGVVIIVDPGHGAGDAGSSSSGGTVEKDLVLSVAKQIQELARLKNINVVLTRSSDNAVSLQERVAVARRNGASLFISLHASYNEHDPSLSGVHCLINDDNQTTLSQSKRLAEGMIKQLSNVKDISLSGIKTSNAYVLRDNAVPAVVLDLGYLSNDRDNAFLASPGNLKRLSEAVVETVVNHIK